MARRRQKTLIRSLIEGAAFQPEGLYELIEASPLVGIIAERASAAATARPSYARPSRR